MLIIFLAFTVYTDINKKVRIGVVSYRWSYVGVAKEILGGVVWSVSQCSFVVQFRTTENLSPRGLSFRPDLSSWQATTNKLKWR